MKEFVVWYLDDSQDVIACDTVDIDDGSLLFLKENHTDDNIKYDVLTIIPLSAIKRTDCMGKVDEDKPTDEITSYDIDLSGLYSCAVGIQRNLSTASATLLIVDNNNKTRVEVKLPNNFHTTKELL